ncbi:hypothetical protein KDA_64040 [Dictyobacter alpinus]|uniref:Transmembrane protein n=1 Tax=Dictyobacter alpinus TaxID=2014873 RepID=A0A402BHY1_9CHLR|nr:hypothetical protein [Dictyobacter alpinus]GCE30920.1 hypothetical protein KDA_64040 [Dictyobacter alpinus]
MVNTYGDANAGKLLWHPLVGAVFALFAVFYFIRGSQQMIAGRQRSWLYSRSILLSFCWLCLSINSWLLWLFVPSLPLAIVHLLLSMGAIAFLFASIILTARR